MADPQFPVQGSCRCGEVQLRIGAAPILSMACHCRGCQKMSASAFSLTAAIPATGFEVVHGEPVVGGMRDPKLRHFFCPQCMSWLFTRFSADLVNVRVTLLNEPAWSAPFIETWTKSKLPWASTPAVHSYEEFPPAEDYAKITADYSQWLLARP